MGDEDLQKLVSRMRTTAFLAVAASTVAILSCVIGLPLAYSYVQTIQSNMLNEAEFCKVTSFRYGFPWLPHFSDLFQARNRDLWNTVIDVQYSKGLYHHALRMIRQAYSNGPSAPVSGTGSGDYTPPPPPPPPPEYNTPAPSAAVNAPAPVVQCDKLSAEVILGYL